MFDFNINPFNEEKKIEIKNQECLFCWQPSLGKNEYFMESQGGLLILKREDLELKSCADLRELAKAIGIKSVTKYKKSELVSLLLNEEENNVKEDSNDNSENVVIENSSETNDVNSFPIDNNASYYDGAMQQNAYVPTQTLERQRPAYAINQVTPSKEIPQTQNKYSSNGYVQQRRAYPTTMNTQQAGYQPRQYQKQDAAYPQNQQYYNL